MSGHSLGAELSEAQGDLVRAETFRLDDGAVSLSHIQPLH